MANTDFEIYDRVLPIRCAGWLFYVQLFFRHPDCGCDGILKNVAAQVSRSYVTSFSVSPSLIVCPCRILCLPHKSNPAGKKVISSAVVLFSAVCSVTSAESSGCTDEPEFPQEQRDKIKDAIMTELMIFGIFIYLTSGIVPCV